MGRNPLFYDGTLDSASYRAWLNRWAVRFVVLPAGAPDEGGERERELVAGGLPYLHPVWADSNWQLFAVTDPAPFAAPHATLIHATEDEANLKVAAAGTILVRIPYSPWLSVVDAQGRSLGAPRETAASERARRGDEDLPRKYENVHGCLEPAPAGPAGAHWTRLVVTRPGTYRLAAPYHIPRGSPCPGVS